MLGIPDDERPPRLGDLRDYREAMKQHVLEAGLAARDPAAARRTPPHHPGLVRTGVASPSSRAAAQLPASSGLALLPRTGDAPAIHHHRFGS